MKLQGVLGTRRATGLAQPKRDLPRGLQLLACISFVGCALSCSPASKPIGKASAHYQVDFPRSANVEGVCNETARAAIASPDGTVPNLPIAGSDLLPDEFGTLVSDGEDGTYKVECSVRSTDTGHSIKARLEGPNTSPSAGTASGTTILTVDAEIPSTGTGAGRVVVFTTQTAQLNPRIGCTLRAIPTPEDANLYQVVPGEARFVFTCPDTESSRGSPDTTCETRGTVWLSGCTQ